MILISTTLLISSCTKQAPMGPEGPQGEIGDPGDKGEKGEKGDDGEKGSASIIISEWVSVNFEGASRSWYGKISDPRITQEVLDKAEIAVFYKDVEGDVHELNYFEALLSDFKWITQQVSLGEIAMESTFNASDAKFRYIIIPASSKVGIQAISGGETTYEFLAKKFKIVD